MPKPSFQVNSYSVLDVLYQLKPLYSQVAQLIHVWVCLGDVGEFIEQFFDCALTESDPPDPLAGMNGS